MLEKATSALHPKTLCHCVLKLLWKQTKLKSKKEYIKKVRKT